MPNDANRQRNQPIDAFCDCSNVTCPGCDERSEEDTPLFTLDPFLVALQRGGSKALYQR